MPSNVLVSGAGSSEANGLYTFRGTVLDKPYYNLVGQVDNPNQYSISVGIEWTIWGSTSSLYGGLPLDVEFPWLVQNWINFVGESPAPTVTEVPVSSQPTFGLPAETVALITSRFGTVANFLRLRNQGQI